MEVSHCFKDTMIREEKLIFESCFRFAVDMLRNKQPLPRVETPDLKQPALLDNQINPASSINHKI